jgi:uncharacterized integral membrane protein
MTEVLAMQSPESTSSQPPPPAGQAPTQEPVDSTAVLAPEAVTASPDAGDAVALESRRGRSRRHARRNRLYAYALVTVALAAAVIALGASNTAKAKVSWVFGSSHVSLVWMILATAVLGWLLGLCTAAALHRRTRAPH